VRDLVDHGAQQAGISLRRLCLRCGMSRQNYYARRRQRHRRQLDAELVVALVQAERRRHPRLGGRKLLFLLRAELTATGVRLGRDRFFALLRSQGLLVERKRVWPKTTNSRHGLPVFRNLVKDLEVTAPDQVWVSDLTYLRTEEGFLYAALITDQYSRKIVGRHLGDTLESIGCQQALAMALKSLPADRYPIHHSDRGCQYCCYDYVELLKRRGLSISMTEALHCYENALAERVNGILKQEYELDVTFRTKQQARYAFQQAVELYNQWRPHLSLDYRTPEEVHRRAA
jgi:putative transposase